MKIPKLYKKQSLKVKLYVSIRNILFDFKKLLDYFPSSLKSIADLACGYGQLSFIIADKFRTSQIKAYDKSLTRIEILESMNPYENLNFHTADILTIRNFYVDVIVISDLFHHISYDDQRRLLNRIKTHSKKGTILIIKDMDKGRISVRHLFNYIIDVISTQEFSFFYHNKLSFIRLFTLCGLEIKKIQYLNRGFIPLNHIVFVIKLKGD